MKIKYIKNINRFYTVQKVKRDLVMHYFPYVLKKKMDFKHYRLVIKRAHALIKSFKLNKFYKVGKRIKLDHNVPLVGSDSYYRYMDRFMEFEDKLSCSRSIISITKDCSFSCKHCYQKFDKSDDLDLDKLVKTTEDLLLSGVTNFHIEGGDPFLKYDRLFAVCKTIGDKGEITINSTGNGITLEKLKQLKSVCNLHTISFSMNSPVDEDINFFMGQDYAWNTIKHGMKLTKIASIPVSLNCCLHSGHYENGNFEYLMELAKNMGVCHVKLIQPKAAGAWLKGPFPEFTAEEISDIKTMVRKFNRFRKFSKYPAITAQIIEEDSEHYGCTAGGSDRVYINANGDVQPCEFLNISYGNINDEDFLTIFNRMREDFNTPGTKWLCDEYHEIISNHFSDTLPISSFNSKQLTDKWDRGDATPLYYKIEKDLV